MSSFYILIITLFYACVFSKNNDNGRVLEARVMLLNSTFNNISVISWQSVLLMEKTEKKLPTWRRSLTNFIT